MPMRIQRKRTRGWRMPDNTVYVGRGSKWGNRHKIGAAMLERNEEQRTNEVRPMTARDAVAFFREDMRGREEEIRRELRGKNLSCWCSDASPCHADVLLEIANGES